MFRTQDPLEAADGIALGVASRYDPGGQVHLNPRIRVQIRQYVVVARAAVEAVGTLAAPEAVVASVAREGVVAFLSVEGVVARAAVEAVVTLAAVEVVVAGIARKTVGTIPSEEPVVAAIADEGIGMFRTQDPLEAADGIALGVASRYDPGGQVHLNPRIRVQIRQYVVVARAAVEAVGTLAAV